MPPIVLDHAEAFRRLIATQDLITRRTMAIRWLSVERSLLAEARQVANDVLAAGYARPNQLRRLRRWAFLVRAADAELTKYADWSNGYLADRQLLFLQYGLTHGADLVRAAGLDAGTALQYDRLGMRDLEYMAGLGSDGNPLRNLLNNAVGSSAGGFAMSQVLFDGMAKGLGPEVVARRMVRLGLGPSFTRSVVIARTETLRVYRAATLEEYRHSNVVNGYRRVSAKSLRTCAACLALDGREYPLDVPFAEHPNGRCVAIPIIKDMPPIDYEKGPDWFDRQSEADQRYILGPGRHDLYRRGLINFDDLASMHHSAIWGDSPRVTSLAELHRRLGNVANP